jgi:hypothetical protein
MPRRRLSLKGRMNARRWGWAVVGLAVLWLLLGGYQLVRARSELNNAVKATDRARKRLTPASVVDGRAAVELEKARSRFASAHRRTSGPSVLAIRLLPVLGRQVRSISALSGAAAEVADIGVLGLADARQTLAGKPVGGSAKVAELRSLAAIATRTDQALAGVDLGPKAGLLGPIASKRASLEDKLAEVRSGAQRGAAAATAVADLLQGPRRYLLLAANNSEMRAGSGMFLSIGVLSSANGSIHLAEMKPAGDLTLPGDGVPIDDPDLAARWGWLHPGREWRNLGASPRFDATAPLAAKMWTARTGEKLDGVLALDAAAVSGVLDGTGPINVGTSRIDSRNVEDILLHDQYFAYPDESADQSARREQLGVIAASALDAMDRGSYDLGRLASGLAHAARGRHVLAWSSHPAELKGWEAAGISGTMTPDSVMVSVLNRAGNKLDHFVAMTAHLDLRPVANGTDATITVDLRNTTPPGQPQYVAGPHPGSGVGAGVYKGIVTVELPRRVGDISIEGKPPLQASGPDGPSQVTATEVTINPGANATVVIHFRLADRHGVLRVEPDARIPVTRWYSGRVRWWADESHTVHW